ncbi:MAG TPA: acyl-CoA dehydrogenase [Pelovirga sp.]|nr:acyl-CoA dehydrogenase [Pelovirga sp.]
MTSFSEQQPATDFNTFLTSFKERLQHLLHVRSDIDQLSVKRGVPPFILRDILAAQPLSTFIPQQYGGRGGHIHEGLRLLSAASYESLPLSLGFGINWALFLQPVAKYAQEAIKQPIFDGFIHQQKMGGLMITEPDYGSDALHMQTHYQQQGDHFHLQGLKHWAGLTGWADYWLLTARRKNESGQLGRDVDFFICDSSAEHQTIIVEEYFENLGIYLLPYGRNRIDVKIPKLQKLEPHSTGIKMMLDLLHRSRMQFPGMALGFLQRLEDEAVAHCQQRQVGGKNLSSYDQVQQRLSALQANVTITAAMCLNSSKKAATTNDLSGAGLEANAVKTFVTDMMQESAQSLLQLVGAKGYRLDHIAGRALVDSRPFQIFEGSNDILYIQIAEAIQKLMQRRKESNLLAFISSFELTSRAADYLKDRLNIDLTLPLSQRRLNAFGQLISRIIALQLVEELGDSGYNRVLIANAREHLIQRIAAELSSFVALVSSTYHETNADHNNWLDCFYRQEKRDR